MNTPGRWAIALIVVAVLLVALGAVMTWWIPYVAGATLMYFAGLCAVAALFEDML